MIELISLISGRGMGHGPKNQLNFSMNPDIFQLHLIPVYSKVTAVL